MFFEVIMNEDNDENLTNEENEFQAKIAGIANNPSERLERLRLSSDTKVNVNDVKLRLELIELSKASKASKASNSQASNKKFNLKRIEGSDGKHKILTDVIPREPKHEDSSKFVFSDNLGIKPRPYNEFIDEPFRLFIFKSIISRLESRELEELIRERDRLGDRLVALKGYALGNPLRPLGRKTYVQMMLDNIDLIILEKLKKEVVKNSKPSGIIELVRGWLRSSAQRLIKILELI